MFDQILRFYAKGDAVQPDPHGAEAEPQRRRAIARKHQEVTPGKWAWVATAEPETCKYHHDLVKACKDGDLWAADEATAKICGVKWDPTYGGERDAPAKVADNGTDAAAKAAAKALVTDTNNTKQPASAGGKA